MDNTPYDDVFKTLLIDCTELMIPVANEIFGEHYTGNERIIRRQNEHYLYGQDAVTKEKVTDSSFEVDNYTNEKNKKYHIECQSTPDGSMLIRMFEYDSQIALDDGEYKDGVLNVTFPNAAVLLLRHTKLTPDSMTVMIDTPGGSISCRVPIMKIQMYTIDEIFEKRLFFLIPFYIFNYEKRLQRFENDVKERAVLEKEYLDIRIRLDELAASGKISEYTKCTLLDMTQKVVKNLTEKYQKVQEGVVKTMGGKVLDYEAKDILRAGIREGMQQGEKTGVLKILVDLVHKGILSASDAAAEAAEKANIAEDEFKKLL